ncbi:D-aminoacyl-tRNA deacylase [Nocardia jejuensis]|uniref:D-aminoacyl-tRNA deacylase n=1 Tax=Nocardia jejuensis TaxID=328049 RepID=UPI000836477F|nr:D-aminoacyl-tRNA deacylase [Nocardia jejuensis]
MRILVQRVSSAQVSVDGETVGRIDPGAHGAPHGLVALVGVTHSDTEAIAKALADKLFRLRILEGERSAADLNAPILVISQFTLYADTAKGRRPSWNAAAPGAVAEPIVDAFADALRELGATVATGKFGAHMQVELTNDGPVTILLES